MSTNMETWKRITNKYKVDLFCGLFLEGMNEGFSLSPEVMLMLGQRGIEIGFDIYSEKME